MLRFAEEIVLLMLNDEDGRFVRAPRWSVNYALAGGVLMDLALENRIDTDLEKLVLLDSTPTGDGLLDPVLAEITADRGAQRALLDRAHRRPRGRDSRRVARAHGRSLGILERKDDLFLWVFRSRRYPSIDRTPEREVKLRIMGVLFSDEIPEPRDIVIICLADACGIFKDILSARQLEEATPRIEQVRKLDLIGQAMAQAIQDIETSIAASMQGHMY